MEAISFPLKIKDNIFITDINSLTNDYLQENKITHLIIIDKYLELNPDKINNDNYEIMDLKMDNPPKPDYNFLFGLSNISRFISKNNAIFISEQHNSFLLYALLYSYLISKKNRFSDIKKILPLCDNFFEEYIQRLEEYDKYINVSEPDFIFKCGKCRKNLFIDKQLMLFHDYSAKNNYSNKRKKNGSVNTKNCTSYFLNIEKIIGNKEKENEENLNEFNDFFVNNSNMILEGNAIKCKKCKYKLGEFFPKGTQCSCGSWVVPAIQIVKSKVDKVKNEN